MPQYGTVAIPLRNTIRIIQYKQKTSRQFWKDLQPNDKLELTYNVLPYGHDKKAKVDIVLNNEFKSTHTADMVATMLRSHFEFEIEQP